MASYEEQVTLSTIRLDSQVDQENTFAIGAMKHRDFIGERAYRFLYRARPLAIQTNHCMIRSALKREKRAFQLVDEFMKLVWF